MNPFSWLRAVAPDDEPPASLDDLRQLLAQATDPKALPPTGDEPKTRKANCHQPGEPPMTATTYVRWMLRRDLPTCAAIDSTNPGGWDARELLRRLREKTVICLVAETNDQIHGWIAFEVGTQTYRVLRVAVHPSSRRQGVATALLARVCAKALSNGKKRVDALVPDDCLAGQLFLRACEFKALKVLHALDDGGDLYLFRHLLTTEA